MRIGFRSRRRGMIDKILTAKRALVGRMRASPVPISNHRPRRGSVERAAREAGAPVEWAAEIRFRALAPPPPYPRRRSEAEHRAQGASALALAYAEAGVRFISVCTDADFGGGRLADLNACRLCLERTLGERRPDLIADDFITDAVQVESLAGLGADAVILRPRLVAAERLAELLVRARDVGLGTWVEIGAEEELEVAWRAGARALLVSPVDLDTLRRDDDAAIELCRLVHSTSPPSPSAAKPIVGLRIEPERLAGASIGSVDLVFSATAPRSSGAKTS